MRSVIGVLVCGAGTLCALAVVAWVLVLAVPVAREAAGMAGVIAVIAAFPLTVLAMPWYALVHGDWLPLLVAYGGGLVALVLIGAGSAVVVSHLGSSSGFGKPRRRLPFFRS